MKKKIVRIAGNILFYSIMAGVLSGAWFFSNSTEQNKSIAGYRFYEVLSGSMEPTIKKGELIIIRMTEPEEIKIGDIVTRSLNQDGSRTLTHRVIDIYEDEEGETFFQTKGDNSPDADEPIPADTVIGVVKTHIPYVGYIAGFVKKNLILTGVILISVLVIVTSLKVLLKKEATVDYK